MKTTATKAKTRLRGCAAGVACACLALSLTACSSGAGSASGEAALGGSSEAAYSSTSAPSGASNEATSSGSAGGASGASTSSSSAGGALTGTASTVVDGDILTNSVDGEHVIEVDGATANYEGTTVNKTGDSDSGDEADFYGDNSAIFATNGATLDLKGLTVDTDGTHANAVFSYGEGTTVNVSDSTITTSGNCSGGLMTTGGGTMNATDLTVATSGNSSAAIRSDRGGGTVVVTGGSYTTSGAGSPAIYSTADITVNDATLESRASQGVVVEGKNSVTLNDVELIADNNTKNSDKSDWYQAIMIYQSMSGDAANGEAEFTMNGGSLTNANGDVFFVNNTVATISLSGVDIANNGDGAFLRAAAAGWGKEGSNGGQVTLNASKQVIDGDMVVDEVSNLNLYLNGGSVFTGAINSDGAAGAVYVELSDDSKWVLTDDSYVTSLTCGTDSIDLNGHVLYVAGEKYEAGAASTGNSIEVVVSESQGGPDGAPGAGQEPPDAPDGEKGSFGSDAAHHGDGAPPEKPSGEGHGPSDGSAPPEKPSVR